MITSFRNIAFLGLIALFTPQCTKSTSTASSTTTTTTTTNSVTADNATSNKGVAAGQDMTTVVPSSLALSLFTSDSTALRLGEDPKAFDPSKFDMKTARESAHKLLRPSKDTECLPDVFSAGDPSTDETCYQFDQDMLVAQGHGTSNGMAADGKEACMVVFARKQVAQISQQIEQAKGFINGLLCTAQKNALAKGTTVTPPKPGDADLDLSTDLKSLMDGMPDSKGSQFGNVKTATLSAKYADEGKKETSEIIYTSTIEMVDSSDATKTTQKITLTHFVDPTNSELYHGTLAMMINMGNAGMAAPNGGDMGAPNGQGGDQQQGGPNIPGGGMGLATTTPSKVTALSITYRKDNVDETATSDSVLNYELRRAQFADYMVDDVFGADGYVNFNPTGWVYIDKTNDGDNYGRFKDADKAVISGDNMNDAASAFNVIRMKQTTDVDLKEKSTDFAYWQNPGANFTENARGLVANIARDADGNLAGCSASGGVLGTGNNPFGDAMSIRRSYLEDATLTPQGFFHPQAGQGMDFTAPSVTIAGDDSIASDFATNQHGYIITQQCFKQTDGLYVLDGESKTQTAGYTLIRLKNEDGSAVQGAADKLPPPPDAPK